MNVEAARCCEFRSVTFLKAINIKCIKIMYNKLGRMKLALHIISGFQHKCGWNNLGYDYTIQYNTIVSLQILNRQIKKAKLDVL